MKESLRNFTYRSYRRINEVLLPVRDHNQWNSVSKAEQILLTLKYRELVQEGRPLPNFREVGWRNFSQTDDDGILLFLFAVLGTTNLTTVEVCAGDGIVANSTNLLIHHGWRGYYVDGDAKNCERGRLFYSNTMETIANPPYFDHAWVDREGINDLLKKAGFSGEVDLFSLDMDGVDYWVWEAMTEINPRVVVVEYNAPLGGEVAWTVPYKRDFMPILDDLPFYCGASLQAFVKLAKQKGYRLVGCNRDGFNAFFVRNDLGQGILPEVPPSACNYLAESVVAGYLEKARKKGEWVSV